jgi:quinoprotein glucose dehydrogenase
LEIREVSPVLRGMLTDKSQLPRVRADALVALDSLREADAGDLAGQALADQAAAVRIAARSVLTRIDSERAIPLLVQAARGGETIERQAAWARLGELKQPAAAAAIADALDRLLVDEIPADTQLDLLAAAQLRRESQVKERLGRHESKRPKDDPLASWQECQEGGDAERGRSLFFERAELSCVRCHKIGGTGGDVGPDLSKIAADKQRGYLLEAIVAPSKTIAKNFESVVVLDLDGVTHTGVLKQEDQRNLSLMTAEGKLVTIARQDIQARKVGTSAMPEDLLKHLSKFEMRDLIEYLATLK